MEDSLLIQNVQVVLPTGVLTGGNVLVQNGHIAEIFALPPAPQTPTLDGGGAYLLPGFVDIHIHGGWGVDIMTATSTDLQKLARNLALTGTTTFLPTTMTATDADISRALFTVQQAMADQSLGGAQIAGLHIEGPYLNPDWAGAQDAHYIRTPDATAYLPWLQTGAVKLMTVAPEIAGGSGLLQDLQKHEIAVAIGHSDCRYEDAMQLFEAGLITQSTHTFNRMGGDLTRHPGVKVATLNADTVTAQVIADGVHLHPGNLLNLYRRKGADKVAVITDAIAAMGLPNGTYELGGQAITKTGHTATLSHQPETLAGAVVPMHEAFRIMLEACQCPIWDAAKMCSTTPARAIGLQDRGAIEVGQRADLVLLNKDYTVKSTLVGGQLVPATA